MMESGIYTGTLRHRRFHPARHEFTYPLFMVFLDVDRLPELMKVSPLAAYNRRNWSPTRSAITSEIPRKRFANDWLGTRIKKV